MVAIWRPPFSNAFSSMKLIRDLFHKRFMSLRLKIIIFVKMIQQSAHFFYVAYHGSSFVNCAWSDYY